MNCRICGMDAGAGSYGGRDICGCCDCGNFRNGDKWNSYPPMYDLLRFANWRHFAGMKAMEKSSPGVHFSMQYDTEILETLRKEIESYVDEKEDPEFLKLIFTKKQLTDVQVMPYLFKYPTLCRMARQETDKIGEYDLLISWLQGLAMGFGDRSKFQDQLIQLLKERK